MAKYSSKINKIRTFALSLIFIGFIIMYIGIFFRTSPLWMTIFMVLGLLSIMASMVVYFWIGMLSTKAVQVSCPNCGILKQGVPEDLDEFADEILDEM